MFKNFLSQSGFCQQCNQRCICTDVSIHIGILSKCVRQIRMQLQGGNDMMSSVVNGLINTRDLTTLCSETTHTNFFFLSCGSVFLVKKRAHVLAIFTFVFCVVIVTVSVEETRKLSLSLQTAWQLARRKVSKTMAIFKTRAIDKQNSNIQITNITNRNDASLEREKKRSLFLLSAIDPKPKSETLPRIIMRCISNYSQCQNIMCPIFRSKITIISLHSQLVVHDANLFFCSKARGRRRENVHGICIFSH